jgi:hypothetical protein
MNITELFWSKVDKSGECWVWTASCGSTGYGQISVKRRAISAHRFSYELANGPIPSGDGYHGTCVLHRCDNRRCVNPAHLFLGTARDNAHDRDTKGRARPARGTANLNAKLNETEVLQVRRLALAKEFTQRQIGALFGVSQKTISRIALGIRWRHLPPETVAP